MAYLLDSILLERGIVVAYDRPGFGLSYRAEEMILDEQVAGLERVMAEYAGHEIYLIGHSYGAPVILQAAMGFSRQVAGIVWVGGIVEHAWREDAWWRKPLNYPPTKWLVPKSMVVSNREIINLQADLEKLKLKWKDVTCPVVILQGDKDWLADKSNATFADSMLVNATFKEKKVIKNASHFFYFSKTHFVVDALEKISSFADK
jgi:pimeloyl-ACP methyl ester carboxylesterase